jgi:hypothetical protein
LANPKAMMSNAITPSTRINLFAIGSPYKKEF